MLHRHSPVVVMATHKDDPMDLGPFLKEYVLNNPFTPTPSPPPPCPIATSKVTATPVRFSPSPPSRSLSPPETKPVVPVAPPVVCPVLKQTTPYVLIAPAAPAPPEPELPFTFPGEDDPGKLIDTPKAHIGSNASFATMLREMKLPEKHIKVKKWLLRNYRHLSNSSAWVSSDALLRHAHKLFSSLKSSVMSRIMKFTFPNCRKVINKYGYFYIGLVRKPEGQHVADKLLSRAAVAVECGNMTPEGAAKMHGVSLQLLTRIVAWQGVTDDPSEEDEEDNSAMSEGESDSDEAPAPAPSPRTNLKWQLRQRSSSRILAKMKYGSRSEAESTSPAERSWRPRGRGRGRPRGRVSSRFAPAGRPKPSVNTATNSPQTSGVLEVKQERVPIPERVTPMECRSSPPARSNPVLSNTAPSPISPRKIQSKSFQVKAERIDPGYDKYETGTCSGSEGERLRNGTTETRQPFAKLRRLLVSRTEADTATTTAAHQAKVPGSPTGDSTRKTTVPDSPTGGAINGNSHSNGTGGRTSSLNSVVDLLTVKQELQKTKEELATKSEENAQLEMKLIEVNSELNQLKQTVSQQETQMADLATDFFELSNRFMKMSHKFKQALSDMKSPKSNSD